MVCGVYKLKFNGSDKVYVGQSVNCASRLTRHIREMVQGTNSKKLNDAFNTFGIPIMEVLEEVSLNKLNEVEDNYIQKLNCVANGFNTAEHAGGGCSLSGEQHPLALYSNEEIICILKYILNNPSSTFKDISTILNVSNSVIAHIFRQDRHIWIKEAYPELWEELTYLKKYKSRGEAKGVSIHKNTDILDVFNILIECPDIPYKEVSEFTGVSLDSINALAKGTSFKWLQDEYPEKYAVLLSLKGTRSRHIEAGNKVSIAAKGIKYPNVLSPEGTIYNISNISAFAREHGLEKTSLHKLLQGKQKTHKGWKTCPEELVY